MFEKPEYFETIVRYGTLSKAAAALGISQPALSGYLKQVEAKAGATLFDRSTSPIVLTRAGKIYYKYLKQADSLTSDYRSEVGNLGSNRHETITIGGASSTTAGYLSNVTMGFLALHPDVSLRVLDGLVSDMASRTLNGEIDFFITPVYQKNSDFKYIRLLDERIFLCVPENIVQDAAARSAYAATELTDRRISMESFLAGRIGDLTPTPVDARVFADSRFILLEDGTNIRSYSNTFFDRWGFEPENPVEVTQMMTGFQMCTSGVGITFLPESILKCCRYKTYPAIYAIDEDISRRNMYACYKSSRYMSGVCLEFIEMLRDQLRLL